LLNAVKEDRKTYLSLSGFSAPLQEEVDSA